MFETVGTNYLSRVSYFKSPYKSASIIDANEYCQLNNGTLASPETLTDLKNLVVLIKNIKDPQFLDSGSGGGPQPPSMPIEYLAGIVYNSKTNKWFSMNSGKNLAYTIPFNPPAVNPLSTSCLILNSMMSDYMISTCDPMPTTSRRYLCEKKF